MKKVSIYLLSVIMTNLALQSVGAGNILSSSSQGDVSDEVTCTPTSSSRYLVGDLNNQQDEALQVVDYNQIDKSGNNGLMRAISGGKSDDEIIAIARSINDINAKGGHFSTLEKILPSL